MDAEIHQLNAARHLMGRPITRAIMYSEKLAHPDLTCPDTEMMKLDFSGNGSALLFITWANDLEVRSKEGNFRESVETFYMVSDQGWRVTREGTPGAFHIMATRDGKKQTYPAYQFPASVFDRFALAVRSGEAFPPDLASVEMARDDIVLVRSLLAQPGKPMEVKGM
jgi:predicted dehydrogenase